ncbi:transglycosylase SLT domain-containing protein [Pseudomonas sp. Z1-12]|uniref:lytic transglycosylase domain-containing protein n=1 Tax=Pseudomonas sp. Z1-12 TaxID=2817408 RepID=UPI003DA90243
MPTATANAPNPRSLARSIQIAILALGSLCAGCQTVEYSQPRLERTPRLAAGLAYKPDGSLNAEPEALFSDLPRYNGEDVWLRIAQRSGLAQGQSINKRIAGQRDWLLSHPGFMHEASRSAGPYLHYIVERLDERQLPLELALLPMIESSYNPTAYSPRAAAGLWQFVPATGRDFNLHQSATYDARRDVVASSKAAMDYLTRLHDQFNNDWLLALAAYNAGEGTVGRAIEANRRRGLPVDYWHLTLPRETEDYVPRLLALSLIVRSPEIYGVQLNPVANAPYFDVVELNHAVDLDQLASMAGVGNSQLLKLNSAFLRKKTLDGPSRLLIPRAQSQAVKAGIERLTGGFAVTPVVFKRNESPVAERRPVRPTLKSAKVVEPALPVPVVDSSTLSQTAQATQPIEDRSSPRRREFTEYHVEDERMISPRVVVYASDPRQ